MTCRYWVATGAMHATTIKQQTTAQATSLKLSVIASVKACCLTCRPKISPALRCRRQARGPAQHAGSQPQKSLICGRLTKLNAQPKMLE